MPDNKINIQFANDVAARCLSVYKSIGKKGKPEKGREWSKMAAVVKTDLNGEINVVTMATGTKCIGEKKRCSQGYLLNDSHAEILARRLLLRYFYHQILLHEEDCGNCILYKCDGLYCLKDGIKFHLFSTDLPCGDASIFPQKSKITTERKSKKRKHMENNDNTQLQKKSSAIQNNSEVVNRPLLQMQLPCDKLSKNLINNDRLPVIQNRKELIKEDNMPSDVFLLDQKNEERNEIIAETDGDETLLYLQTDSNSDVCNNTHVEGAATYSSRNTEDIHRTGAKSVPGGKQDLLEDGESYHVTEALRIKPGRGDRTISMSCSDKMMKWCILGIQGGLLANLLKHPIFLSTVIINNSDFNEDSLTRALSARGRLQDNNKLIKTHLPVILQTNSVFPDSKDSVVKNCIYNDLVNDSSKNNGTITSAGTAILYCPTCNMHEVSANGRKHGITKKDFNTPKARTAVCKRVLLDQYKLCRKIQEKDKICNDEKREITYFDHKHSCKEYEEKREEFFLIFHEWIRKPKHEEMFS